MVIIEVTENKKQYIDLLLLADEQEDMIDRYLDKGTLTDFLEKIFEGCEKTTVSADDAEIKSFERFMQEYKKGLAVERLAVEVL